ncbi:MAG: argininosuccinate lyase [Dehalococcoidia bacterium]
MNSFGDPAIFLASLDFDKKLAHYDIQGSTAWAQALSRSNVLSDDELESILTGLQNITKELNEGIFPFRVELEDIHFNIERRLIELVGPVGGKLHSGRSRNDQIATDIRLFCKDAISNILVLLKRFQKTLVDQAEANIDVMLPGYTHLQRAQPVLLAHHLLAYFEMTTRDVNRFKEAFTRVDVLPLGSAALSGTPYGVDREWLAQELGFGSISLNSMDAVSDRDFITDIEFSASLTMIHLSRLCEEIILWSSEEFGYVTAGDAYTSGSSIMPQKRNPDIAELIRGKVGRVAGALISTIVTLKGLPLAYNRDLQEDKEPLFDVVNTLQDSLDMMAGMVESLEFNTDRMDADSRDDLLLATEFADYLTKKGVPFRESHGVVKSLFEKIVEDGVRLSDLELDYYREFSSHFDEDIKLINTESAIAARDITGATSKLQVIQRINDARVGLSKDEQD